MSMTLLLERASACADRLQHLCDTRLRGKECANAREEYQQLRDALAHLTQPAQSVDVGAIPDARPLPELMMASYHEAVGWNAYREALITRAIGNAQSVNVRNVVLKSLGGYLERHWSDNPVSYDDMADKLTAALQEKGK